MAVLPNFFNAEIFCLSLKLHFATGPFLLNKNMLLSFLQMR